MANIEDIPYQDIKDFLLGNDQPVPKNLDGKENIKAGYTAAWNLIKKRNLTRKILFYPDNVIKWMMAYNLLQDKVKIPTYSSDDIMNMSKPELNSLAKLLGMKTVDRDTILDIYFYLGKLSS